MARQNFVLNLRIRRYPKSYLIRDCEAILYDVVTSVPYFKMDLQLDDDTSRILKKIVVLYSDVAETNVCFVTANVHGKIVKYNCDGLIGREFYIGDLLARLSSSCSLALLFRILSKCEFIL